MKPPQLDAACLQCLLRQAERTADAVGASAPQRLDAVRHAARVCAQTADDSLPVDQVGVLHRELVEVLDNPDPWHNLRGRHVSAGEGQFELLNASIDGEGDPLRRAISLSAHANAFDIHLDPDDRLIGILLRRAEADPPDSDALRPLLEALQPAKRILFVADSAGELVFDRLLMQVLFAAGKRFICAVRTEPLLVAATLADARAAQMDSVSKPMAIDDTAAGMRPDALSPALRKVYDSADLILAKGMAHYQSLHGCGRPGFALIAAKCRPMADGLGIDRGRCTVAPL